MSVLEDLVAAVATRSFPRGVALPRPRSAFAARLRRPIGAPIRVIAEVKRASPSQGSIQGDAVAREVASRYALAGAAAISVLTEPTRFGGSFDDLRGVSDGVAVPTLCKDFVVLDEQVRAARLCGASAVLLIVRILGERLPRMVRYARDWGLEPLVEVHTEAELPLALASGATVIGVNNRDLDTLDIDRAKGEALLARIPRDRIRVAESGYESPSDIAHLDADAVLVGTSLMRNAAWLGAATSAPAPSRPLLKVCGLTRTPDVEEALGLGADALGFILTPALARSVQGPSVAEWARLDGVAERAVLVFRRPGVSEVERAIETTGVRRVQLHDAAPDVVEAVRRAASVVVARGDGEPGNPAEPALWDVGAGGSGRTLGWDHPDFTGFATPSGSAPAWTWIAGGITPENVPVLLRHRPFGIDVSSGIESSPGIKDHAKMKAIFAAVRG